MGAVPATSRSGATTSGNFPVRWVSGHESVLLPMSTDIFFLVAEMNGTEKFI